MQDALIVEDLTEVGDWLATVLTEAFPAVRVHRAARLDEALARVDDTRCDLALVDLGLPDGNGLDVVRLLRRRQPAALSVVVTIHNDDDHLFPALQAGAFGYLLKEQEPNAMVAQLLRMVQGEPPLSPPIARRVLAHFAQEARRHSLPAPPPLHGVHLTERETEVLQRVAKGYTLPEIARQFGLSRHTVGDYVKQVYRKLNVSSRAEATLEAARLGLVKP